MNAKPQPSEPQCDQSAKTLGDLLYADKTKDRESEENWLRLIQSIAGRNQRALDALYDRTHRIVFTLAMRITRDRQIAEEVTLDVFHEVWKRASRYDPANGSVVGWIMNQARSRAIDRVRFETRKKRLNPGMDKFIETTQVNGFDDAIDRMQQGRILRTCITALSPEEREAIEIAYFSELTHSEAAARLNQPLGTIKTRIRSGLEKLRVALVSQEVMPS